MSDERQPNPIDVRVGARVRLRRKALGVSQQALGESLGITFQQVQKYELGANRVSASRLVAIAQALETSVAWLVAEDGDNAVSDSVYSLLTAHGAYELLKAYAKIEDASARAALLTLAQSLSTEEAEAAA